VKADGGWPIQLAQSDERQYGDTWSPDGKWIVFQQDTGGNELWDVFAIPSDGGAVINLSNTPEIREESPRWSPDGKTIALNTKPKEATVYNITLLDWATRKMTPLTHESTPNHLWQSVAWSPDGKTLYADRLEVSFTDADVYAIDRRDWKNHEPDRAPRTGAQHSIFLVQGWAEAFDYLQRKERLPKRGPLGYPGEKARVGHGHQTGGQFVVFPVATSIA